MAIGLVADSGSVAVEIEGTEGVYQAETAGASFVEVLADGLEFSPTRELLVRNNRTNTVESVPGRVGVKSMAGTIPIELKSGNDGDAPETDALWRSLLGARRQLTAAVTSLTGHTSTDINLSAVDVVKFAVGDIIKVEEAGATHYTPVTVVDATPASEKITVLIPFAPNFTDNVVISKFTTYYHAANAPTLSITNYLGGEIREKAIGCRCVSAELNNFTTGQLGDMAFNVEGLDFDREVGTPLFTPVFDSELYGVLPPAILQARLFKGTTELCVNNFTLSVTNEVGFLTCFKEESGKQKSRITGLEVGGSFNPYMEDNTVANIFDVFNDNTGFSLFVHAQNPDSVAGEFKEGIAFYLPNVRISELATGVEDGILTDAVTFTAHRSLGNDTIFVGLTK